jgi:hypothetical protein
VKKTSKNIRRKHANLMAPFLCSATYDFFLAYICLKCLHTRRARATQFLLVPQNWCYVQRRNPAFQIRVGIFAYQNYLFLFIWQRFKMEMLVCTYIFRPYSRYIKICNYIFAEIGMLYPEKSDNSISNYSNSTSTY